MRTTSRLTVTKQELVADNVAAFGHREAAKKLRKAGVPFSIAYWLIFGVAPVQPCMPEPVRQLILRYNASRPLSW